MKGSYDILGNIAVMKFPDDTKKFSKIREAKQLLKERKSVKTVVEKNDKVRGRLRTIKTVHLAGEKNLIAEHVENGCKFKFNVETCYFSSRLSNERKEIALQIKKNERVLFLFGGVGVFAIVAGKMSKCKEIYSVELGRDCSKYAKENVVKNKLNHIHIIQGDVKKVVPKFVAKREKFDHVVMPRPNLKDTFLPWAFRVVKKNGMINYYGFGDSSEEIVDSIKEEAKKAKKKIKIVRVKKAGDIAPRKYRWRIDFRVLS